MRQFALSPRGVRCDAEGAFVGPVSLLKRKHVNGKEIWEPRGCEELSAEISAQYGLPIDIASKANGLTAIARSLNAGAIARAQIATLFLNFPKPPPLAKNALPSDLIAFICALDAGGLIKANWDPDQHPRWPGGSPNSRGGKFSPRGTGTSEPGIGHNQGPPLEADEAAAEETESETVLPELLGPVGLLATADLLAMTQSLDSGEESSLEQIHMHHPWPKYLSGTEEQLLSRLPAKLHMQYHGALDQVAPRCAGTEYYDSLGLEERAQLFEDVAKVTKRFDAAHGTNLYDDMIRNGFPVAR